MMVDGDWLMSKSSHCYHHYWHGLSLTLSHPYSHTSTPDKSVIMTHNIAVLDLRDSIGVGLMLIWCVIFLLLFFIIFSGLYEHMNQHTRIHFCLFINLQNHHHHHHQHFFLLIPLFMPSSSQRLFVFLSLSDLS